MIQKEDFKDEEPNLSNSMNTLFGVARSCCSISIELALRCCCCRCLALCIYGHGFSSEPIQAFSSRTGCRTVSSDLLFTTPQAGINVQGVLSGAGSTSYKDKLAVPVLVRLVFQLNDLDMKPLLLLYIGTWPGTEYILIYYVHVRMHRGGNR